MIIIDPNHCNSLDTNKICGINKLLHKIPKLDKNRQIQSTNIVKNKTKILQNCQ